MSMHGSWQDALGRDNRGSRPRCIEFVSGTKEEVATNFTDLVGLEGVKVAEDDFWMPHGKPVITGSGWDTSPAKEARVDRSDRLVPSITVRTELGNWWLAVRRGANTPNWDLASTCMIEGRKGLLLVEAKAHFKELSTDEKKQQRSPSANSRKNHEKIRSAIMEANADLERLTGRVWRLSRDSHYQLSNRFAWSWKFASLQIPVVLLYLGFLNAYDMVQDGALFESESDWSQAVFSHACGVVDEAIWGRRIEVNGTPFWPLVRATEVSI